jgi:hypothetical protein
MHFRTESCFLASDASAYVGSDEFPNQTSKHLQNFMTARTVHRLKNLVRSETFIGLR